MSAPSQASPWDLDDVVRPAAPERVPGPAHEPNLPPGSYLDDEPTRIDSVPVAAPVTGMTPAALNVMDSLLDLAAERPVMPNSLVADLHAALEEGTKAALEHWPERSMWVSKAALFSVDRCEAGFLADRSVPRTGVTRPIAVGQVAHKAIQVGHTHPGLTVDAYVRAAVAAQREGDQAFAEFWDLADIATQSDVIAGAVSRATAFFDSWPVLAPEWAPRFEDPLQARVGKLTLSARPDLVMGRPRPDLRQTMLLCDFKTGELKDEHVREASFYALVSTLRHGVAPYRSCVYSLGSAEWVQADLSAEALMDTVSWVNSGVRSLVDMLGDRRAPLAVAGGWCSWCPAKSTCVAFEQAQAPS